MALQTKTNVGTNTKMMVALAFLAVAAAAAVVPVIMSTAPSIKYYHASELSSMFQLDNNQIQRNMTPVELCARTSYKKALYGIMGVAERQYASTDRTCIGKVQIQNYYESITSPTTAGGGDQPCGSLEDSTGFAEPILGDTKLVQLLQGVVCYK